MSTLADSHLQFQPIHEDLSLLARPNRDRRPIPELHLALVHDDLHEPAPLVSILAGSGLPPNGGVLPLCRAGDLAGSPAQAIVVAADLRRPEGLAAVRSLRRVASDARIVVTAGDASNAFGRQTLNAGADAFVPEQDAVRALAPAVRAVVAGLVCVPRVTRRLVAKPTFSHREKEVLNLLVAGETNAQIADRLYLSKSTVKRHVASAFAKLGVRSRKDAAAILLDPAEGLIAVALTQPQSRPTVLAGDRTSA
jgi:DNA-binding NarL/FixJ family response regulator